MGLSLEPWVIASFAIGLVLLYLSGKLLLWPIKNIFKLAINSIIGAVVLVLIRLFLFPIAITPLNAILVGIFGLPGVMLILLVQLIFI